MIHDLDLIRHGLAFSFAWYNWVTNVTASLVIFVSISFFWPRARRAYKDFFLRHMTDLHEKIDAHHEELLRQNEDHHSQQINLVRKQHAEVMFHVKPSVKHPVAKKAPVVKKAVVKKETP